MAFVMDTESREESYTDEYGNTYGTGKWYTSRHTYYIYCGKCGCCDVLWLNQDVVEQERENLETANWKAREALNKSQNARDLGCVVATLLCAILPPVGLLIGIILMIAGEPRDKQPKIRTYKFRCKRCGFEFDHTFPNPKEDNPLGYITDSALLHRAIPLWVYVDESTKEIRWLDERRGNKFITPTPAKDLAAARKEYFARMKAQRARAKKM